MIGGVNATAVVLAAIGPAVYVIVSVWVAHDVSPRDALKAVGRIAVLTVGTSLWWLFALTTEGRYGLPLLSFTETVEQVATTSSATEALRGLGYWISYIGEHYFPETSGIGRLPRRHGDARAELRAPARRDRRRVRHAVAAPDVLCRRSSCSAS